MRSLTIVSLIAAISVVNAFRIKSKLERKFAKALNLCSTLKKSADVKVPKIDKSAQQFVFDVCPYTGEPGFHFVCTPFSFDDAWQVCNQAGWRLAVVNAEGGTSFDAFDITDACIASGTIGAWIASYEGMGALPCMYMQPDGTIIQSNGLNCDATLPVICQDLPPATSVIPATTNFSPVSVTLTSTIQVCPTSPCNCTRNCRRAGCLPCHGGRNFTDALGNIDRWPHCCDPQGCDPLCPTGLNDLYVIQAPIGIPFSLADRECRKYGLHLADLTSALLPSFQSLSTSCAPDGELFWIRSFNGVGDEEPCVWAMGGSSNNTISLQYFPIGYGVIDSACFNLQVSQILCQDRPPAQLGHGPFLGASTIVTTIFSGTANVGPITTVSTTFTTVTFFP